MLVQGKIIQKVLISTEHDELRRTTKNEVQNEKNTTMTCSSDNLISTSTTSYEVKLFSKLQCRASTTSYWYQVVLGALVTTNFHYITADVKT